MIATTYPHTDDTGMRIDSNTGTICNAPEAHTSFGGQRTSGGNTWSERCKKDAQPITGTTCERSQARPWIFIYLLQMRNRILGNLIFVDKWRTHSAVCLTSALQMLVIRVRHMVRCKCNWEQRAMFTSCDHNFSYFKMSVELPLLFAICRTEQSCVCSFGRAFVQFNSIILHEICLERSQVALKFHSVDYHFYFLWIYYRFQSWMHKYLEIELTFHGYESFRFLVGRGLIKQPFKGIFEIGGLVTQAICTSTKIDSKLQRIHKARSRLPLSRFTQNIIEIVVQFDKVFH